MIIDWELTGHGWARCRLSAADGQEVGLVCGYLTDALADLVAAAGGLYGPAREIRFFFDDEPTELRWVLSRAGSGEADDVEVTVYRFPDVAVSPDLPDSAGTVVWRSTQSRPEFAHAVLEAAEAVLARYGEEGYRERWGRYDYPVALVQDLRRLHLREDACGAAHDQGAADAPEADGADRADGADWSGAYGVRGTDGVGGAGGAGGVDGAGGAGGAGGVGGVGDADGVDWGADTSTALRRSQGRGGTAEPM